VASDGTLARNSHIVSSTRLGVGQYLVVTDRDVSQCSALAQVGAVGTESVPNAAAKTAQVAGDPTAVAVTTYISSPLDSPFHLQISC
jgi:hypothetical protein